MRFMEMCAIHRHSMGNSFVRLQEDSLMKPTSAMVGFGLGFEAGRYAASVLHCIYLKN